MLTPKTITASGAATVPTQNYGNIQLNVSVTFETDAESEGQTVKDMERAIFLARRVLAGEVRTMGSDNPGVQTWLDANAL